MEARKPDWLKVRLPSGESLARYARVKASLRGLDLHTVCEEARCPNAGECWGGGTATFMVLGDTCTRSCRFCAVRTRRRPPPPDPAEPGRLARAVARLRLDYVVLTTVDRDDLSDQGAAHVAACIRALGERCPGTLVEALIPDFRGDRSLLDIVAGAGAAVLGHNIETVERLSPRVRDPRASYSQSIEVLRWLARGAPGDHLVKSSLMVGLGERPAEVLRAMRDLRAAGVALLTIGQYLRPSPRHVPVADFVPPERFESWRRAGIEMGFEHVAAGPLVRSSYRAGQHWRHRRPEGT